MKDYWARVHDIESTITAVSALVGINEERSAGGLSRMFQRLIGVDTDVKITRDGESVYIKVVVDGDEELWSPRDFAETVINAENVALMA